MFADIKNLVFSSGGINGILSIGCLKYLETLCPFLRRDCIGFGGTSIGALIAFFCIIDMPTNRMFEIIVSNLNHVDEVMVYNMSFANRQRCLTNGGDIFLNLVRSLLMEKFQKSSVSFSELEGLTGKTLKVCALNVNQAKSVLFGADSTPHVDVASAVVASLSVPLVFAPVNIDGELYLDGALMRDFIFDSFPSKSTIGVWLKIPETKVSTEELYGSITKFAGRLWQSLMDSQHVTVRNEDKERIICITPTSFPLPLKSDAVDVHQMLFTGIFSAFMHVRSNFKTECEDCVYHSFVSSIKWLQSLFKNFEVKPETKHVDTQKTRGFSKYFSSHS